MSNLRLSQQEAAQELLNRRKARRSFADFCRYVAMEEPPAKHHMLICDAVDQIVDGDLRRVMIMMPPGSAKSTYGSVLAPAYILGRLGQKGVITASYGDTLATRFGRKTRNLIKSPEYSALFPNTDLAADSQAKGEWETTQGGFYFATGVGGGVTGRRADLAIIDDPIRGRADADSELIRSKVWDWYIDDLRTRLKPNAAVVLIMTRWHEDDLAGRILPDSWKGESGMIKAKDGEMWQVICLPAQARENDILGRKEGEWLWQEWFSPEFWEQTKASVTLTDARTWNSLYQQTPKASEGTFFRREWFHRYELGHHPVNTTKYISSDFAVSEGKGDFTEFGTFDIDTQDDIWVTDWWFGRESADVWVDRLVDLFKAHKPMSFFGESGVIRKSVEPFLNKAMRDRNAYSRIDWINRTQDKAAMARAFQSRAAQGKVHIPYTDWGNRLIEQLCAFPAAKHDDAVDVCALIGLALDEIIPGMSPKPKEEPKTDAWGRYRRESNDRWKTM